MSKTLKSMMVADYRQELDGAPSCVVVDVSPLKVGEVEEFRRHLREKNIRLRVVRNRLAFHAIEGSKLQPVRDLFVGPTAIAFDADDAEGVSTVKVIKNYQRDHKKLPLSIRGGFSEGQTLDVAGVDELALIPDRPQLQAILLGTIMGPARGLAVAMAAVGGGLARVLQARIDKDEGGGD